MDKEKEITDSVEQSETMSKKEAKELSKLKDKYEKLKMTHHESLAEIKSLKQDITLYKASHDKVMELKHLQDILIRKEKEVETNKKYAAKNFIADILIPFELFEKTLSAKNIPLEVKNWMIGFEMILKQFQTVLENNGVKAIQPTINSEPDGHFHEVIDEVNDPEVDGGKIAQVARKGYMLHDRVIQYAQVKTNKHNKENK